MNIFQAFSSFILRYSVIYLVYHPRKGAKTRRIRAAMRTTMYHPRKGAKTMHLGHDLQTRLYHSRKGAKTVIIPYPPGMSMYHPRKGAKTCGLVSYVPAFQYHPRKGTKNSASKKMRSFSFANLNSLFSVGCPSMNGTIAAAVIFSMLRLLHSDKMCYNKANSKHLLQNQQIRFSFIVQFFHN